MFCGICSCLLWGLFVVCFWIGSGRGGLNTMVLGGFFFCRGLWGYVRMSLQLLFLVMGESCIHFVDCDGVWELLTQKKWGCDRVCVA